MMAAVHVLVNLDQVKKSMVCHFDQILSFQSEINNIFVTSKHSRNGEQINSFVSLTVLLYELVERTILI